MPIEGTLPLQILFQGKWEITGMNNTRLKDLTSNTLLLDGIQHILSTPPCLNMIEYKRSKKEVTKSTTQSSTYLVNDISH
jgi:hypothetical protein